jgi:tetratricopeptide (TPR) repeat protein
MTIRDCVTCSQFRDEITEYLEEALSREEREIFEEHRDRCVPCQDYFGELADCIEGLERLRVDDLSPEKESELVALLNKRERSGHERDESRRGLIEGMLRELMSHSPEQRMMLIENSDRFKSVELCEFALERGFELGAREPAQALELTNLAVLIVDIFWVEDQSAVFSDLRVRAYALRGNALRISSDFVGAARSFEMARELTSSHSCGPSAKATMLALQASLHGEQLEFERSLPLLEEATTLYKQTGETVEVVRTSLVKAMHLANSGKSESAAQSLLEILQYVDELAVPRLSLAVRHNLAFSLVASGRSDAAKKHVPEIKKLHMLVGNAVDVMRFKWLEGQIAVDSDQLKEAEELFVEVKQFFVEKGMAHDVALVSLDLAVVYLRQQRVAELKALASEMLTIFRALRVHQETLAALAFCRRALDVERMTVGLVNELAGYLEKARERARFGVGLSVAE